jgi:hypothetical protein
MTLGFLLTLLVLQLEITIVETHTDSCQLWEISVAINI